MEFNPFEVNAALERLIAGLDHDGTAAQTVLEYALQVPLTSASSFILHLPKRDKGKSIFGYVPGFGNLRADTGKRTVNRVIKLGTKPERIGEYRLWRTHEGRIYFRHYWDFERPLTEADPTKHAPTYHLVYDPETTSPIYFAQEVRRVTGHWTWPIKATFFRIYLEAIHGEVPEADRYVNKGMSVKN